MMLKSNFECVSEVFFHHETPEELQFWRLPTDTPSFGEDGGEACCFTSVQSHKCSVRLRSGDCEGQSI